MKKELALGLLGAAMCISLAGCGGAPSSTQPVSPSPAQSAAATPVVSTPTPTPAPTPEPTPEPSAANLAVNDSVDLGDWNITVTGFELTTRIDNGYTYFSPDDGNQYAVVSVSVVNNGKQSASFLPSFSMGDDIRAKIYYNGDYEYSSVQLLAYDKDLHDESMNPLTSKDGVIVFTVPDAVANGDESLVITFSLGSDKATFDLK